MFSDSTLQPALKKLPAVKSGYSVEEEWAQLSEKAVKILHSNYVPVQDQFFLHTSTKTGCNWMKVEIDIQKSSYFLLTQSLKKSSKIKTMPFFHFLNIFEI